MTPTMKKMLRTLADSAGVNAACIEINSTNRAAARTIMALYKLGMLQIAEAGGLELSDKGRAAAAKVKP